MKKANKIKNLTFFDREQQNKEHKSLQKSIEQAISKESYEWITMQVQEDGSMEYK